ncbi:DNA-binding MarR family transcriptional regulator [Pseudonocardia sediminis]|uniref:DNA-binding MarR family transcriptional regulator n=1 Tax=Pseudonocardia sediminis TaxID=1397368 RepID=A0A4Q7UWM9_PSEST|nr:MarR family transcriptional regulator [Pseudonocardia sediminis]RZT86372.1 DNA-binding MarR family transcriptional regulator [Pseudonocardia sediminis]
MAHPRWLDEEQQRTWRAYLAATRLVFERVERQMQSDSGMPQAYYEILVRLSEAPEHTLRMSLLATSSLSSRSRVSHAVARMEESGWIRRRSCPTDRRGQLAELTDEGMRVLREAAPGHATTVQEVLFDGLSPGQQAALLDVGEALVAHLSTGRTWPADDDSGSCPDDDAPGAEGCPDDSATG